MGKKTDNNRMYSVDIIKIFAMFLVVTLHLSGICGIVSEAKGNMPLHIFYCGIEGFSFVCVNLFALTTGFLCSKNGIRISGTIKLWIQAISISVVSFFVVLLCTHSFSPLTALYSFFPLTFESYWYLNEYILLALISPFLNMIISKISSKKLLFIIMLFTIALVIVPTVMARTILNSGYSFVWLAFLYVIGAYIRKNKTYKVLSSKIMLLVYILTSVMQSILIYFTENYDLTILGAKDYNTVYLFYNNIFNFFGSIALFSALLNIRVSSEKIKKCVSTASGVSFTVFLVHVSPAVWECLLRGFRFVGKMIAIKSIPLFFLIAIGIYVGGTVIGLLQNRLFIVLKINNICNKIESFVTSIFNKIYNNLKAKIINKI